MREEPLKGKPGRAGPCYAAPPRWQVLLAPGLCCISTSDCRYLTGDGARKRRLGELEGCVWLRA